MAATAPAQNPVQAPALSYLDVRGLVFVRMRSIKFPDRKDKEGKLIPAHTKPGEIIARMREGGESPLWGAEA